MTTQPRHPEDEYASTATVVPLKALSPEEMVPEMIEQITAYADQTVASGIQGYNGNAIRFQLPLVNSGAPDDADSVLTVTTSREGDGWRTTLFLSRTADDYDTGTETQVGYFVAHHQDGSIDTKRLESALQSQLNTSAAILLRRTLLRQQYFHAMQRRN